MAKKIIKPIKPEEIVQNLDKLIPSVVIESVNELLMKKFRNTGSVKILQKEIIELVISKDNSLTRTKIYDDKMMDFEELYRQNGWVVKYDSPSYGDNDFDSYFMFSKSK